MRKIGSDSWCALVVVAAVLVVALTVELAPAPPPASVGASAGPVGLVPGIETVWNIAAILFSAAIAAGAAILAARLSANSTMANARELQDRERRKDEESCAAILAADLHKKLTNILTCLEEPTEKQVANLAKVVDPSTKVLDAVMPKLGNLGQDGAANLLNAYLGVEFVVGDSEQLLRKEGAANFAVPQPNHIAKQHAVLLERTRHVAGELGFVIHTLWQMYELARPHSFEEMDIDLEKLGFKELKDRGL